ncbi:hypothetical protein R3P38DRAFT_2903496 [Favolaschia claudopus]|uniref:Uncharacterized protein n=1 Tax=Favolaschia claudopus TaxID=2862362 RepID=A0AAW0CCP6_9AGAR
MPSRAPRYYIGKDPSRFKCPPRTGRCIVSSYSRPVSSANPNAQPSSIFPATYAAQPESSWAYQPTISQPVKTPLGPRNKPINFAMPISVTPTYPRTQPEQPEYGLTTWPVWCVFCQHTTPPTVPACYTADIRRLFPSPSNIPAHLAALGILHDLHLRSFATLPANDQYTFLRSRLTQFQVAEFFDALFAATLLLCFDQCPIHKRKDEASAPRALLDVLCSLGMEEVGSIAVSLGIRTDAEFERACQYEEQIKKRFMLNEMGDMRPSAFQKFILEIALRSPA